MTRIEFIAFIESFGFVQNMPLQWIKREPEKYQHWLVFPHAAKDTFTLCLRDYEKCSNIPFPENETDLQTFFKIAMKQ